MKGFIRDIQKALKNTFFNFNTLRLYQYVFRFCKALGKASCQSELVRLQEIYLGKFQSSELIHLDLIQLINKTIKKDNSFPYRDPAQRPVMYFPFLIAKPFHERDKNAALLEQHVNVIREEFYAIESFSKEHPENLVEDGKWDIYTFYRSRVKYEVNCTRCPKTIRIIEQLPHCCNWEGLAYFSILEPGTHITAHCGPTNGRIRYHLGLEAPEGARLRVKDEVRSWIPDKCLIFDDSFEHEVFHEGKQRRVVLIVDLWHPELNAKEREVLANCIAIPDFL